MKFFRTERFRYMAIATIVFVGVFVVVADKVAMEQCPDHYTQAQVDASDCIVGANIGQPLALLAITGIWFGVMYYIFDHWDD